MKSAIVVSNGFDGVWPFSADHFHELWKKQGAVEFIRLEPGDTRATGKIVAPKVAGELERVVALGVPFTKECLVKFAKLKEIAICASMEEGLADALKSAGVRLIKHTSEGFWGESVSEFGFALTLCALRRIPQTHHQIISELAPWNYGPPDGVARPAVRGQQYGDDSRFTSGTLEGKRVRIVGAGNIASRYASFANFFGADVAAWDPFASEPCFHRAGSRREHHLERLVQDAEIFAPMVPLMESTKGIVTARHIDALPKGCLVVMVTRAMICDMAAVRRRVMADELALAADVFDVEPLPLNDPLLGRHNVVHTPHNAGRTRQANERYAEALAEQFKPQD